MTENSLVAVKSIQQEACFTLCKSVGARGSENMHVVRLIGNVFGLLKIGELNYVQKTTTEIVTSVKSPKLGPTFKLKRKTFALYLSSVSKFTHSVVS